MYCNKSIGQRIKSSILEVFMLYYISSRFLSLALLIQDDIARIEVVVLLQEN